MAEVKRPVTLMDIRDGHAVLNIQRRGQPLRISAEPLGIRGSLARAVARSIASGKLPGVTVRFSLTVVASWINKRAAAKDSSSSRSGRLLHLPRYHLVAVIAPVQEAAGHQYALAEGSS